MRVKVFRVENKRGEGPYSCFNGNNDLFRMRSRHNGASHPCGLEDFGSNFSSHHYFGFDTASQAFEWFDGYLEILSENGFVLSEYEVNSRYRKLGKSGLQVVFASSKAKLTQTHHLTNTQIQLDKE